MKIFLIGTHGAGKTTTFNLLKQDKTFEKYLFVNEYVKKAVELGASINGSQSYWDFEKLFFTAVSRIVGRKNCILDRAILDCIVYAIENRLYVPRVFIKIAVKELKKSKVFLFRADSKKLTTENNLRWMDEGAQKRIDKTFEHVLRKEKIEYTEIPIGLNPLEVVDFIKKIYLKGKSIHAI